MIIIKNSDFNLKNRIKLFFNRIFYPTLGGALANKMLTLFAIHRGGGGRFMSRGCGGGAI